MLAAVARCARTSIRYLPRQMDANRRSVDGTSRPAREIVNLVDDDDDVVDNAGVWPGFADLDEMDLWKGIVLSMGEGTA